MSVEAAHGCESFSYNLISGFFMFFHLEIDFEDVKQFCDSHSENNLIEYKGNLKAKGSLDTGAINKTVSAFANTDGGVLIIGASEDKVTKEVTICGIEPEQNLEERIYQTTYMGITRGIRPTVKVVDIPETDNIVIIIQVQASELAPHMVTETRKVYNRVGNTSQECDIHAIEQMFKRRDDTLVFANQTMTKIKDRAESICPSKDIPLSITIKPMFLDKPIISVGEIYEFAKNDLGLRPETVQQSLRKVYGGCCLGTTGDFRKDHHEYNEYGILYYKSNETCLTRDTLERIDLYFSEIDDDIECLQLRPLIWNLSYRMMEAKAFYTKCLYMGDFEVTLELKNTSGKCLLCIGPDRRLQNDVDSHRICLEDKVTVSTLLSASSLMEKGGTVETFYEIFTQILWVFNAEQLNEKDYIFQYIRDELK